MKIFNYSVSPNGNFIVTWSKPIENIPNLIIWNLSTSINNNFIIEEKINEFVYKKYKSETWPIVEWTKDEKYYSLLTTNTVTVYSTDIDERISIHCNDTIKHSLSPNSENLKIACFIPEKKGKPGRVDIFDKAHTNERIQSTTFFNAESANFLWSKDGNRLLFLIQTEHDKTGKSYYGQCSLYLMNLLKRTYEKITLTKVYKNYILGRTYS